MSFKLRRRAEYVAKYIPSAFIMVAFDGERAALNWQHFDAKSCIDSSTLKFNTYYNILRINKNIQFI